MITYKNISFFVCCGFLIVSDLVVQTIGRRDKSKPHPKTIASRYHPKGSKYILYWNFDNIPPLKYLGLGSNKFIEKKCSVSKCYMVKDQNFFKGDLSKFEAIIFNGRNLQHKDLPRRRYLYQKYIFINMECSLREPVCNSKFDMFFNWTSSYKLNSDIPYPYIIIRNKTSGAIVGPKAKMAWIDNLPDLSDKFDKKLRDKSRIAAWFVSNCKVQSKREVYVKKLQKALEPYGHKVDVYGSCGTLACPKLSQDKCNAMLSKYYYFYLAFENSFDEDYVTEKLTRALQNNVIPIVYGGANYSRFLSPGSYLDARKNSPVKLAAMMDMIMNSRELYRSYFKWQNLYIYSDPTMTENVCAMCEALHNKRKMRLRKAYRKFREWWAGPDYKRICRRKV